MRERVERLPMRPRYIKVRARSENEGSGTAAMSDAAGPACFRLEEDEEDDEADVVEDIAGDPTFCKTVVC